MKKEVINLTSFSIIFPITNPPARHITAPNMRTPISPSDHNGSKV